MNIEIKKDGTTLTIIPEGRIDAVTSSEFEATIQENIAGITELTFDLSKVVYLSSIGLRVFMETEKIMHEQGKMELINVSEDVFEIFELVGLNDVFTFK